MSPKSSIESFRQRRSQRGAAVFVVMLVVVLLSSLGLFAVRSASLTTSATGYQRQMLQTHYVTDLGVYAMAADLTETGGYPQVRLMTNGNQTDCENMGAVTNPTCAKFGYDYFENELVKKHIDSNVVLEPVGAMGEPGSLGLHNMEGDLRVELTDYHRLEFPIPGFETNPNSGTTPLHFSMLTISATGVVRPAQATADTWDVTSATAAGIEQTRAHAIIGPLPN